MEYIDLTMTSVSYTFAGVVATFIACLFQAIQLCGYLLVHIHTFTWCMHSHILCNVLKCWTFEDTGYRWFTFIHTYVAILSCLWNVTICTQEIYTPSCRQQQPKVWYCTNIKVKVQLYCFHIVHTYCGLIVCVNDWMKCNLCWVVSGGCLHLRVLRIFTIYTCHFLPNSCVYKELYSNDFAEDYQC